MKRQITVALAGNPNCGKTTIFNQLTGSRQHVGNYPGITVDKKSGFARSGAESVRIIDLPGTYSLTAYSQEEIVARRSLAEDEPDVVLQVIDAGALERNLYLTVQLRELGIPVVLALNMMDEVRARGDNIDSARLSHILGFPVLETVGRNGIGVDAALSAAVELARRNREKPEENPRKALEISYGNDLDPALDEAAAALQKAFAQNPPPEGERGSDAAFPLRWLALKYLEGDQDVREAAFLSPELKVELDAISKRVARHLADTMQSYPEAIIADFRYGYISSVLRQDIITRHADIAGRRNFSDKADLVLTHTLLGPLIMFGIFFLVYKIAFELGAYPMELVDALFGRVAAGVDGLMADGPLKSMLISGVISGVGGVMVFVPLILIMFGLIAFLEDSGYMARIAYMLDRVFRTFGLHGSSVMPYLISGGIAGGCAVPGVMATRTLRSPKEKLATMLTLPFMACGAKIPVFLLFVGIFFAPGQQAAAMFCITLAGWGIALLSARLLRSTIIAGPPTPFVMELPPYRLPTWHGLLLHTWERGWQYIKKAATIILAISILLWAAMTFPALPDEREAHYADLSAGAESAEELNAISNARAAEALRHSLAGRTGTALEPVSRLAGFDWRANIALLGGFAAKEVLVSTLGTAYSLGELDPQEAAPLAERIKADKATWNLANAVSLLLFVLIYAPCSVTMVTIYRETGGLKWPLFSLVFSTVLAYILAVCIFQVGKSMI